MTELSSFELPISICLLNHLRSFSHNSHSFQPSFLSKLSHILSTISHKFKTPPNFKDFSFHKLLLSVHYYLSLIYNIDVFTSQFTSKLQVSELNLPGIYSTNIFNIHSMVKALDEIKTSQASNVLTDVNLNQMSSRNNQPKFSKDQVDSLQQENLEMGFLQKFRVQITTKSAKDTKCISSHLLLSYELIEIALKSLGRFDIDFLSILCTELNKAFDLDLYPHLFHNAQNSEQLTHDFSRAGFTILNTCRTLQYTQQDFDNHMLIFTTVKDHKKLQQTLSDLEEIIYYVLFKNDSNSIALIERLLIALLGHKSSIVRERTVIYLNVIYDSVDWQLRGAFKTKISTVNSEFKLEYFIQNEDSNIALLLHTYPLNGSNDEPIMSWHKPEIQPVQTEEDPESKFAIISINFGKFTRAGFYDWKFVRFQKGGKVASIYTGTALGTEYTSTETLMDTTAVDNLQTKVMQGRFIVHPSFTKDLQLHEIYAERPEGIPGDMLKGTFSRIKDSLGGYQKNGMNCLYLNGVLEKGQAWAEDQKTKKKVLKGNNNGSSLAVTMRNQVDNVMGGDEKFVELVENAHERNVKVIVESLTRISSSRAHKKYQDLVLSYLDEFGRLSLGFGGEGRGGIYGDTMYLNYRKKEVWDLLIEETGDLVEKYGVDGFHLDDVQSWPPMFDVDMEELERKELDGESIYSIQDIFYGKIVLQRSFTGYWATEAKAKYANPILIKLCKTLWKKYPELLFVGEVWGGQGYEGREHSIINSGPIPRLFKIPPAVTAIYGKHLHRDGIITPCEVLNVNSLRSWYESYKKKMPTGAILIQSTSDHSWPYPAYLCQKSVWSFIDLFFFMPDIPMTFMGEIDGHINRCRTMSRFQTQLGKPNVKTRNPLDSKEDLVNMTMNVTEGVVLESGRLKEGRALNEKEDIKEFWLAEENASKLIGSQYGYDLKQINMHYEHRRKLRNNLEALRIGKFVPLMVEYSEGIHSHVLSFARVTKMELVIVAINFNESDVELSINMKNLKYIFDEWDQKALVNHGVVKICSHSNGNYEDYYTMYEFLYGRIDTKLQAYHSLVWSVKLISENLQLYEKTLMRSMERSKQRIMNNQIIEGTEVASMLTDIVKEVNTVQEFANNLGYLTQKFLRPYNISLPQMFNSIKDFKNDPALTARLVAFCQILYEQYRLLPNPPSLSNSSSKDRHSFGNKFLSVYTKQVSKEGAIPVFSTFLEEIVLKETLQQEPQEAGMNTIYGYAKTILEYNRLGPIAFITPELGKWSTIGGLGVMVDELSVGLVELGEDVICISPYYERNRKGESGYLSRGPEDINHIFNMEISLGDGRYTVGVHYGKVKGVHLYFLHSPFIFPHPYADGDARFTIQQVSLMAKASLEVLCILKKIPSLIVTNDWFTGLVPAYPKNGHFGEAFKGTKFVHIVHNLDVNYEGRLYPNPNEGSFEYIHNLPSYLFVDPYWSGALLNPSRCALMSCDQWATVSASYRLDLLNSSPLTSILKTHPQPFAFPNGIPKEERMERIQAVCGNDHLKAKAKLQQKYFKMKALDDSIAVFGFVGRITEQKGVHLILDILESAISAYKGKVQFIIGGMANMREAYGSYCAGRIYDLLARYPNNFWANPQEFFTDGVLLNAGSDYGLMPSLFEPGGIVQHEFFIASTPVVAYETGGLKDTVVEFNSKTKKGNGFLFASHKSEAFLLAFQKAMETFNHGEDYQILRKNASESVIDTGDVARAWNKEFYRLFNKNFIDYTLVNAHLQVIDKKFEEEKYEETFTLKKVVPETSMEEKRMRNVHYYKNYLKTRKNLKGCCIQYKTDRLPRPKSVKLIGSYNKWKSPLPMNYDHIMGRWFVTIQLPPGEYFYKFIVDDDKWMVSDQEPILNDIEGHINNYLQVL